MRDLRYEFSLFELGVLHACVQYRLDDARLNPEDRLPQRILPILERKLLHFIQSTAKGSSMPTSADAMILELP